MKTGKKVAIAIASAAVIGGAIWYLRNKKAKAPAVLVPSPEPERGVTNPVPPAIAEAVKSYSSIVTTKPLVEPVATTTTTKTVAENVATDTIQPTKTYPLFTKTYLSPQRALAGLLL